MKLTVQLYTIRNEIAADLPGTLKSIADAGIKYIEGGAQKMDEAKKWKAIMDDLGLTLSGAHCGLDWFTANPTEAAEVFEFYGCKTAICPWMPHDTFGDADKIKAFAESMNKVGENLHGLGLEWLYHNHDFEFTNTVDGEFGLQKFADLTDPKFVNLEVDVAWVKVGGGDPVTFLERNKDRVKMVHLKDFDNSKTPRWTIAGQGTVDLPAVIAFCKAQGVPFGAIELDESPIPPLEAVAESAKYLLANGLEA